MPGAPVHL
jgi:hypothetical protein